MNILILNWRDPKNPKSGGAEQVTMEHAKAWVKKGHAVTWFTSSFLKAKSEEVISGVTIVRRGTALTVHILAFFYYSFNQNRFDVVVDEIHGLPFFTPLYVRKPTIAFIHEVADVIWEYMWPFPINRIGRVLEKIAFRLYRHIPFWTDAPSTVDDLVAVGIPHSQCHAIACPPTSSPVLNLPRKEKLPTYLFVSRIVKMKGIEDVIRAFSFIVQRQPAARLWVVGAGEQGYMKKLRQMVADFDIGKNVTFYGYISEKRKITLMKRAHILLHASVKEGWGLVVLEAAGQATPSVAYNVHGLIDTVKHGKTGVVVYDNTAEALAKAAFALYSDSQTYLSYQKAGLAWVRSLRWPEVTRQSLNLIINVQAKQGR